MVLGPGREKISFGQQLSAGIGNALGMGQQLMQEHQQKEAMRQLGLPENLSPDLQKVALAEMLRSQGKEKLLGQKQQLLQDLFGGQGQPQRGIGQQLAAGEPEQTQMAQGFDPTQITDEKIIQAELVDPQLANLMRGLKDTAIREQSAQKKREFEREKFEYGKTAEKEKSKKAETFAINKPLINELNEIRKNIPLQEQAIADIESAAPGVGIRDYLADTFGIEPLRSSEGVKLKTAVKDFFLSDLTRAGARPNQWIEMQLADALPKTGRDPASNLITAAGMKFKVDLAKERARLLDDLSEKYGYSDIDLDRTANKMMKSYVEERQKLLQQQIKDIKMQSSEEEKSPKGYVRMTNPKTGEVRDILEGHAKSAEKDGWTKK